ncbi:voltage-dependent anion channel-domain-containing protein [Neohortaea acidophila]|uniref:Voltage-dependent anion channel-domain-containing protein n=1 Tax=Neohortaea acidophila TaxID=245834 RepID=A0A6A6PLF0_9PEZI|nr:voltage-dependent anion channel-domain-containing protein [Neohortaea acidophila]KAF2480859.1 voltage-dependent anion channel-domain-containing protein [Neohortaea acidophila]
MANEQHRFTWCMNSGALAILLHQTPLRFKGIDILADILFCIALVTYVVFSILFIARFVWFRKAAYLEITWNACLLFWAFTILIRRHEPSNANLPFSIIIPAVSVSTVGLTGAVISTYAVGLSARLAIPVMIVSFQWTGVGILFGILLTSYLFWSLLTKGWPAPDQTATLFILVGPMGMYMPSTYGRFGEYNTGTFLTAESAKALAPACLLLAFLMNGLGIIWLILGILGMLERAVKRELRWTPAWNGIIFPNSTLTTSFLLFAIDLDSPAYRVITVIMIIALVIVYLVNLVYTVLRVSQGKLLIVREDWRVRKLMEEQKEE